MSEQQSGRPSTATVIEPPRLFPTLRYRDASAMIDWLERAFGFRRHAMYQNEDGSVAHAQVAYGSGMVMLSSARDDDFGRLVEPAGDSTLTQAIYVAVDEVDDHYARAKAAGAMIVMDPTDQPYGSRDYQCRDPEGQLWCFGTYWPRADEDPMPG